MSKAIFEYLLLFSLSLLVTFAQAQVSSEELGEQLNQWLLDYANIPAPVGLDELGTYKPGWLSETQVRTESDRLDFDRQRFALRTEPKMPGVRKAEKRLQQQLRDNVRGLARNATADASSDGLGLLFEMATDDRELRLLDTLIKLQRKLVKTTRMRLVEPNYDVERALDAEEDLADLNLRHDQLTNFLAEKPAPIPLNRLVGLQEIRALTQVVAQEGPTTEDIQSELAIIDAEIELEKAENLHFVDFLQVEFRDDREILREKWSVGTGIQLPRRNKKIRAIDKLQVERLEKVYESELDLQEKRREFNDALEELQRLFVQYDAQAEQIALRSARRERLKSTYLQSELAKPEALLRLERRSLKEQLDLLALEEDIREGWASFIGQYIFIDASTLATWVIN